MEIRAYWVTLGVVRPTFRERDYTIGNLLFFVRSTAVKVRHEVFRHSPNTVAPMGLLCGFMRSPLLPNTPSVIPSVPRSKFLVYENENREVHGEFWGSKSSYEDS